MFHQKTNLALFCLETNKLVFTVPYFNVKFADVKQQLNYINWLQQDKKKNCVDH